MWKPSAVNSCVNSAAAPVTPDALETIATAPSVINGMVVVVVGGSVVVVDVVVVDVDVVGAIVVVVVDVDVVVAVVVVVGTDGGPNVQPTRATALSTVEISISRRASIRSSCPVGNAKTSIPPRPRELERESGLGGEPEATPRPLSSR